MTPQQITQLLESALKILETVEQLPDWQQLSTSKTAHPELATDMGDALHYTGEMIRKLVCQQGTRNRAAGSDSPSTKYED